MLAMSKPFSNMFKTRRVAVEFTLALLHAVLFVLCCAVSKKIPIKGVTTFQPCPADKPLIAAFIAETKGQPAVATVLDHSQEQPVTISRKSFYRATGVGRRM